MKLFEGKAGLYFLMTILFGGLSTIFRKLGVDRIHPFQFQVVASVIYVFTGAIAAILCHAKGLDTWSTSGIGLAATAVLMNTACSISFMYLIGTASNVGLITSMTSLSMVVTMITSMTFLGEQITWRGALGAALILLGVFIASNK